MIVLVELAGALRTVAKANGYGVELEEGVPVSALMRRLKDEFFGGEDFFEGSNLLIMVNGREISALKGAQTKLRPGDKVTLVPVSHGG